jgi:protein-tyrosine phosphatase
MTGAAKRRTREPFDQASGEREIRVDWLPTEALGDGLPGRLGLTHLPGKHGRSVRYPGIVYRRDLGTDLEALYMQGVRFMLLLVEDAELRHWGDPDIAERAAEAGIRLQRRPLPDGEAFSSAYGMDDVLDALREARRSGDAVVACMGGVGRSGMVAACALVRAGWEPAAAVTEVRRVRHPDAVETPDQLAFVARYASRG